MSLDHIPPIFGSFFTTSVQYRFQITRQPACGNGETSPICVYLATSISKMAGYSGTSTLEDRRRLGGTVPLIIVAGVNGGALHLLPGQPAAEATPTLCAIWSIRGRGVYCDMPSLPWQSFRKCVFRVNLPLVVT